MASNDDIDQTATLFKEALMFHEKGNDCYHDKNYEEALNFYTKAIDICPKSNAEELAMCYENRAAAQEKLQNWNEVIADCSEAIKHNQTDAELYFRRANAYEKTWKIRDCLYDATAAVVLEKIQNKNVSKETVELHERNLTCLARMATTVYFNNDNTKLLKPFFVQHLFKLFKEDPVYKTIPKVDKPKGYILAKIAFDEECYDKVIPACCQEIESSDADAKYKTEALLLRGAFHVLLGNVEKGTKDYDAIINDTKAEATLRANAILKKNVLLMTVMNKKLEFADFEEAEKEYPNNPDLYNVRGQMYIMRKQFPEALDDYTKANELAPNHIVTYVRKCCAQYRLDFNHEKLLKVMEKLDDKHSNDDCLDCYFLLGEVFIAYNRFEEANKVCEMAIKAQPKQAILYVLHGKLLMNWKNDTTIAMQLFKKAIEIDNTCRIAYVEVAELERANGNVGPALIFFGKAKDLSITTEDIFNSHRSIYKLLAENKICKQLEVDRALL